MTQEFNRFQIVPDPHHSPMVGALIPMLENCRASVLDAVRGLTSDELSRQFDEKSNPIGALLAHIASVEWTYLAMSIEQRQPSAEEWGEWGAFVRLSPATWAATKGQSLEQHLERLQMIREKTLAGLARKNDAWLLEPLSLMWLPKPANNLWAWYHVLEDELNHRGQIRWLRQRL